MGASKNVVDDAPDAVNVNIASVDKILARSHDFWSAISRSPTPNHRLRGVFDLDGKPQVCYADIIYLRVFRIKKHIIRLQVSMNNIFLTHEVRSEQQLGRNDSCLTLREEDPIADSLSKGAAFLVFQQKI